MQGGTHNRRRRLAVCGTGLLALAGVLVLVSFPAMLELYSKGQKTFSQGEEVVFPTYGEVGRWAAGGAERWRTMGLGRRGMD